MDLEPEGAVRQAVPRQSQALLDRFQILAIQSFRAGQEVTVCDLYRPLAGFGIEMGERGFEDRLGFFQDLRSPLEVGLEPLEAVHGIRKGACAPSGAPRAVALEDELRHRAPRRRRSARMLGAHHSGSVVKKPKKSL